MSTRNTIQFWTIMIAGIALFIASLATLIEVVQVHQDQKVGRQNFCQARVLDHLPPTSICRSEFPDGQQ